MDRVKEIEKIVKSVCNKEGVAKRCPERIADAIAAAGYSTDKQNQEELKALCNELEFTKKDNKYWFGQAHCNFEDMRKGHGIQAVEEFAGKLIELLKTQFVATFSFQQRADIVFMDKRVYDQIPEQIYKLIEEMKI